MEGPKLQRSEGRFIILVEGYVDPYVFKRRRRITIAGETLGRKVMRHGELEYPYPLLQSKQLYLWIEFYYSPCPYPYYPWRYYEYCGPRWGCLHWWKFPFSFFANNFVYKIKGSKRHPEQDSLGGR